MAAVIHDEPRSCDRRLQQLFNSTRNQWIEVVKAGVAARARVTVDHAKSAPGYHAWDAATARMRQIFRREGWEKDDRDGLELILNSDFRRMIAVMNTDEGTGDRKRSPRNRTLKGIATEKGVDLNNQYEMFKRGEIGPTAESPYTLWYLCIFDNGATVRAELSRPSEYAGGYIVGFAERIFIVQDGDWEKITLTTPADDIGQDFAIDVRRK